MARATGWARSVRSVAACVPAVENPFEIAPTSAPQEVGWTGGGPVVCASLITVSSVELRALLICGSTYLS